MNENEKATEKQIEFVNSLLHQHDAPQMRNGSYRKNTAIEFHMGVSLRINELNKKQASDLIDVLQRETRLEHVAEWVIVNQRWDIPGWDWMEELTRIKAQDGETMEDVIIRAREQFYNRKAHEFFARLGL